MITLVLVMVVIILGSGVYVADKYNLEIPLLGILIIGMVAFLMEAL